MAKPVILIIINKIGRGGAEIMLLGTMKELNERYSLILVSLGGIHNHEVEESRLEGYTHFNLQVTNIWRFVSAIFRLKKIIRQYNVNLIHAHLYQSTILGRLASSPKIPFLFSVHSTLSKYANYYKRVLEKMTCRKSDVLIAVSEDCKTDYEKHFLKLGKEYVLRNYIASSFFENQHKTFQSTQVLKMIAVGNVSSAKNYHVLIEAFHLLKSEKVELDIYGREEQPLFNELSTRVRKENLNINFKGITSQVAKELSEHHVFVSSSSHEGFGMTVIEAMAMGLPLILSDIPVFRETTQGNAIFFDQENPEDFARVIHEILRNEHDLEALSRNGLKIAGNYGKERYMRELYRIYDENLGR